MPRWDERESARPVCPECCAVCVGFPTDRDAFDDCVADVQRRGVIADSVLKDLPRTTETIEAARTFYQSNFIDIVDAAEEKFTKLGVTFYRRTTLSDLVNLAQTKDVIAIWTHWEAPPFRPEEITRPEEFVRIASRRASWVAQEVDDALNFAAHLRAPQRARTSAKRALGDLASSVEQATRDGCLAEYVAAALNDLVDRGRAADGRASGDDDQADEDRDGNGSGIIGWLRKLAAGNAQPGDRESELPPATHRMLVEKFFDDHVERGACLELTDGMESVWPLINRADDRPLVLDLTVCNSTELAEAADGIRKRVRVIGHQYSTTLPPGAMLVAKTLDLLAAHPSTYSYLQARTMVIRDLS